jgi:hypothetical protein
MMPRLSAVAAAASLLASRASAGAQVSLVVEEPGLARAARELSGDAVNVLPFRPQVKSDPLEKGRFLAALRASDLVYAVGPESCAWIDREIAGAAVRCVPPYSGAQILDYARRAGWTRVVAVYTRGYEGVFRRLRAVARARGVELVSAPVRDRRGIAARVEPLLESSKALWILGDPLLTGGPAFDYLIETSLTRRLPLISPEAALVARGAYLSAETEKGALVRHAVALAAAAAGGAPASEDPEAGPILVNPVLARRWGLVDPRSKR